MLLTFPVLDSRTSESWLWQNPHHILDTNLEHMPVQPPGEHCPSPVSTATLQVPYKCIFKRSLNRLSSQVLQDGEEYSNTSELCEHEPTATSHLHQSEILDQKQRCVDDFDSG